MELAGEVKLENLTPGLTAVVLSGEHDLGTAPEVRAAFGAVAEAQDGTLVDLSGASFVDSSILGAVLEARRAAQESGRSFAVVCDGSAEPVQRVLDVTGLTAELPVYRDRAAAIESLRPEVGP